MARKITRSLPVFVSLIAAAIWMAVGVSGQSGRSKYLVSDGTTFGDWPTYNGDVKGSRYSPLDQINGNNFNQLEVAWHFKTDAFGTRPEYKLEGTPLAVHGTLYATGGTRRAAFAMDGKTGELLWMHQEHEGTRAVKSPRQLSGRGLAYWTDGKDERVIYITTGYRMISLDAKTGEVVKSFGTNGVIDLKQGMYTGTGQQIDLETGEAGVHSTPVVAGDIVLVGSAFREGMTITTHNNTKGLVRAFDARTGKLLWTFHTIPKPGEEGNDTWLNDSWASNGNTGVWTQISVDEEAGLAYLPVETPTSDYYGGHRPGNNLFSETLVCVDLKTGQRKWYFQLVHHALWDMDISSAPIIADIVVDGKPIKAVAQPTKQGWLYVFDRITGKPVWPIVEKPVAKGDVPGEWYAPTQPFPTKPPIYSRNGVSVDDLIDFTPQLRQEALELIKKYKIGPVFTPPVVSKVEGPLATLTLGTASGGTNWPGASYDPETHIVYAHACDACLAPLGLIEPPSSFKTDMRYVAGRADQGFHFALGPGEGSAADVQPQRPTPPPPPPPTAAGRRPAAPQGGGYFGLSVEGLPLIKPPYGTISAISLDKGDLVWQVAHGDTPDVVRNSPALKGLNIPKTGQVGNVGTLVTKTLVVSGDPQVTTTPQHPRGAMLRAYDKATGNQVGAVFIPGPQSGSPMTYELNGKQYIVVSVSGGNVSGEYIAFSLPSPPERPTSQPRQ